MSAVMADDSEWEGLPLDQQLVHKVWKARAHAYEKLAKQFELAEDEDDDIFNDWNRDYEWPRKAVTDTNAVAQEKGVHLVSIYSSKAGKPAARCRGDCMTPLVDKCLAFSARKGTREAAIQCVLGWAQTEADSDKGEGVMTALMEGLGSKQPKVVAGAVAAMSAIIGAFGVKVISPKPLLKTLPKIFGHADKTVRAEGTTLTTALYTFLGPAIDPSLLELKTVQVKELHEAWAVLDAEGKGKGSGKATRETAAQKRERIQREAQEALEGGKIQSAEDDAEQDADAPAGDEESPSQDVDPYDLADPVAVLSKLPPDFYEHLGSSKWKERKEEALDPLVEVLKVAIKVKPDSYDELVKALAGRMTDANNLCVIGAANSIERLANGLRTDFGRYRSLVVAPMLEKFKEKKANVVEALSSSLDAVAQTVAISEFIEDFVAFAKHKNPAVKEQNARFLVRMLRDTRTGVPKGDMKPLSDLLMAGMDDAVVPVRESSAEGLGTLMRLVGQASFQPIIEKLDDIRKAKVQEYFEKAVVKYKPPKAKPPPPKASSKPIAKAALKTKAKAAPPPVEKENEPELDGFENGASPPKPVAKPPARLITKKPSAPAPIKKSTAAPGPAASASKGPSKPVEPLKYRMTQEDADARAGDVLDAEFVENIANSVWKIRVAAMDGLLEWLPDNIASVDAELLIRFLNKKPGPKESNFQVWQRVFSVYSMLADQSSTFSKACMALSIGALTDKYGDAKIKESAATALTTYAEKSSLGFVFSQAFDPMSKQKAVKMQSENFLWIDSSLQEFGIGGVPIRDLIEFLKSGLKSANAVVRTNATKALVTTKLCVGADMSNFLQDLNPQLLSTIEAEFAKIAGESPPVPTRVSADNAPAAGASGTGKGKSKSGGGDDSLDELFPRVDIDKLITSALIKSCDDTAWKTRKEALEQIQRTLETNKRLKPNLGNDLATALKQRMNDANKAVQLLSLDIVARIATGMGQPFDRYARPLLGALITVLADKNAGARNVALATLTSIADACGLDAVVGSLATGLETPKPELRSSALGWLVERMKDTSENVDLSPLAGPVISCLEDRNPDVRKGAQGVLPAVVASAGFSVMMSHTSSLKPASKSTVVPMLENARMNAPSNAKANGGGKAAPTSTVPGLTKSSTARATSGGLKALKSTTPVESRPGTPDDAGALSKSRLGVRRPGAANGNSRASTIGPSAPASHASTPVSNEAALRTADSKPKLARAAKEIGLLKWIVDGAPRKDQIEQLHLQFGPHVSSNFLGQLFSKDHHAEKDYNIALTELDSWALDPAFAGERLGLLAEDIRARLIANVDLIFKYISIRLSDTSTTITMKCIELIDNLFTMLQADSYRMSEYEASILLPSVIAKSGDSKEVVRNKTRGLYRLACTVYPFSKVFSALVEHGLKSKNSRVRAESAEELSALFQRQGLSVCQPAKALPAIAALIADRDPAVRNGALSALASAYASAGEGIHKYLTNVTGKERDMLNERLKRTEAPPSPAVTKSAPQCDVGGNANRPTPSPTRPATSRVPARSGVRRPSSAILPSGRDSDIQGRSPASRPPSSASVLQPSTMPSATSNALAQGPPTRISVGSRIAMPSSQLRQLHARDTSVSSSTSQLGVRATSIASIASLPAQPGSLHLPIADILSGDEVKSTQALKVVQADIEHRANVLVQSADILIEAVATQMRNAFEGLNPNTPQSTLRLCKHLMQTLSAFFDQQRLATSVSKEALVQIIAQLTQRLQETAEHSQSEAITTLSKVLNLVLIRIFHNSNRSACFGALFQVLRDTTADIRMIMDEFELAYRAKYAELVMKCLWKVSKTVKESLEDGTLDTRILLKDIDDFLVAIPPAEWRRRAADAVPLADMPLRTVKTILQQVVSIHGESVYDMLSLLQNPDQSFTYQYLFRLLNNSRAALDGATPRASVQIMQRQAPSPEPVLEPAAPIPTPPLQPVSAPNPFKLPSPSNGPSELAPEQTPLSPAPRSSSLQGINGHAGMGEVDLNNLLTDIFAKIGSPTDSKKGIAELYDLLKQHPEGKGKVDKWIGATGTYFQAYLRRALNNLKAEDEERQAGESAVDITVLPSTPKTRTSIIANASPSPGVNADRRISSTREQDLSRLQSLFGFSGHSNGETPGV